MLQFAAQPSPLLETQGAATCRGANAARAWAKRLLSAPLFQLMVFAPATACSKVEEAVAELEPLRSPRSVCVAVGTKPAAPIPLPETSTSTIQAPGVSVV